MKKEELLSLGIKEEAANEILSLYQKEIKGYVPKSRFMQVNNERKALKAKVNQEDEKIEMMHKIIFESRIREMLGLMQNLTAAIKHTRLISDSSASFQMMYDKFHSMLPIKF